MKMMLLELATIVNYASTGDPSQVDLPRSQTSGLSHADRILQNVNDISHTTFDNSHVVRHRLIQKIIQAYDKDHK